MSESPSKQCPSCSYDMAGVLSDQERFLCPECGMSSNSVQLVPRPWYVVPLWKRVVIIPAVSSILLIAVSALTVAEYLSPRVFLFTTVISLVWIPVASAWCSVRWYRLGSRYSPPSPAYVFWSGLLLGGLYSLPALILCWLVTVLFLVGKQI